jgi:hypothetical protein
MCILLGDRPAISSTQHITPQVAPEASQRPPVVTIGTCRPKVRLSGEGVLNVSAPRALAQPLLTHLHRRALVFIIANEKYRGTNDHL